MEIAEGQVDDVEGHQCIEPSVKTLGWTRIGEIATRDEVVKR
jgi:hypothetical protein